MSTTLIAKLLAAIVLGTVGVAFILFHPIGAALVLTVISPFDGLFIIFGNLGNIVTFIPIAALMVRTSPVRWIDMFAGTRIQVMFLVVLAVLSISHLIAIQMIGVMALIQFARKLTIVLVVGVFASAMRNAKHLELMNRALAVSFAVYMLASLLDFYLGIHWLPGAADTHGGALGLSTEESVIHELRFRGGGISINATGNWLITPAFVALGWFTSTDAKSKPMAFACLTLCVIGIFATMSRSSILGFAVGMLLVLPYISRLRPAQVIFTALSAVLVVGFGLLVLQEVGFLDAMLTRFFPEGGEDEGVGRTSVFGAALRVWMTSPVFGVGDGTMAINPHGIGFGAHNSFLGVLAEAGVVGFIPFALMVGMIVYRLARPLPRTAHPTYLHWRPFFLAGYVGSMTMSMFNEYPWERMTWYAVAFAVALDAGSAMRQRGSEVAAAVPADRSGGWVHPDALRSQNEAPIGDRGALDPPG